MGFSRKFIFYHDCKSKGEFNFEISLKTCQESVLKSNLHITNQYLLFGILILKCNFHIQTSPSLVFYLKMQFTHEKSSISYVFNFLNAIYKPSLSLVFHKKCIYTLQTQPFCSSIYSLPCFRCASVPSKVACGWSGGSGEMTLRIHRGRGGEGPKKQDSLPESEQEKGGTYPTKRCLICCSPFK